MRLLAHGAGTALGNARRGCAATQSTLVAGRVDHGTGPGSIGYRAGTVVLTEASRWRLGVDPSSLSNVSQPRHRLGIVAEAAFGARAGGVPASAG